MIKFVGYYFLFFSFSINALVPIEGIILGHENNQTQVTSNDIYNESQNEENKKMKLYEATYKSGESLFESCRYLGKGFYSTFWDELQAKRAVVATLQYIGLDTSIKALGAYARSLNISQGEFTHLKKNLIHNYCSKNLTVLSLRNVNKSFDYYYKNPEKKLIPSVGNSPFASEEFKKSSEELSSRSREFDLVIKNFRSFCSWGGDVEDYRMLAPYLSNRFIMSFVIKNLSGVQEKGVQVSCSELICRKKTLKIFNENFPLTLGSTGIETDVSKLFCHHFSFQHYSKKTIPQMQDWIKASGKEDLILETNQFISLITGVPDLWSGVQKYHDIIPIIRSSLDRRWTKWATEALKTSSKDLFYEESFKIKTVSRSDQSTLLTKGFGLDFSVTLGEMDQLINIDDHLGLYFNIKLSKNYLRFLRSKSLILEKNIDLEGLKSFKQDVANHLGSQLKVKEKLFKQKMWNEEFLLAMSEELIKQTRTYVGPLFESYQDEMIAIPVKFSYGLFAISYMRYRADIAAGRLKLNLYR